MRRKTNKHDEAGETRPSLLAGQTIEEVEARNVLLQFDMVRELIEATIGSDEKFYLSPEHLCDLNQVAIQSLESQAGKFRTGRVFIDNSTHNPPEPEDVPHLVDEMCRWVNDNWDLPAVTLASYVMWRLNWIHPFVEGNGRTSRAVSYLILSIRLGYLLPGTMTIPEQIMNSRTAYYEALDAADDAFDEGRLDVSEMENVLGGMLIVQLESVVRDAVMPAERETSAESEQE